MMNHVNVELSFLVVALVLACRSTPCFAEKDGSGYSFDNPLNDYKMYWKDAPNVLEDLSKFQALYITVHGCVWSSFWDGGADDDDDGEARDGDEQWYLYRTQSFRANAAYSLYGVLRQGTTPLHHCQKATYINSFFTFSGATTLSNAFNIDDSAATNYCSQAADDDDNNRRRLSGSGDDDNDSKSTTMGCSIHGDFQIDTFQGSYCDGHYFLNTTDTLNKYNQKMMRGNLGCKQVWSYRNSYNKNKNNDDDANNGGSTTTYGSIAETLLSQSAACDIVQYPNGVCPDPYGVKKQYAIAIKRAQNGKKYNVKKILSKSNSFQSKAMTFFSWFFLLAGATMGILAFASARERKSDPNASSTRRKKKFGRSARGSSDSNTSRRKKRNKNKESNGENDAIDIELPQVS